MNNLVCQHDISRNGTNCTIIMWTKGDIDTGACGVVYDVNKYQDTDFNLQRTGNTFKYYTCKNLPLFGSENVTITASVYGNGFGFIETRQVTCSIVTPPPPTKTAPTTLITSSLSGKHI